MRNRPALFLRALASELMAVASGLLASVAVLVAARFLALRASYGLSMADVGFILDPRYEIALPIVGTLAALVAGVTGGMVAKLVSRTDRVWPLYVLAASVVALLYATLPLWRNANLPSWFVAAYWAAGAFGVLLGGRVSRRRRPALSSL